ncbi:MAG: hypothetical protein R2824_27145 [Saprospiraceae bacterium]|nr:hypothetical protein [Lewinella sp.]
MKKPSFCTLLLLVLAGHFPPYYATAAPISTADPLLFRIGLGLMLTENFEEAESCFSKLATDHPEDAAVWSNRGTNLAMWGLSLMSKKDAEGRIKYVFPFEIKPNSGRRGNIENVEEFIGQLFDQAAAHFEKAISIRDNDAGSHLNLASVQAIQGRWRNDNTLLRKAMTDVDKALQMAPGTSATKGHCHLVKGILFDYIGNASRRDEMFDLAHRQYQVDPDTDLASLAERNQTIAEGGTAVFTSFGGETYNVFTDEPESIDGISLQQLMNDGSLDVSSAVISTGDATLYEKKEAHSALYIYYKSENRYVFFHQTTTAYSGTSSRQVRIGDNEAHVRKAYGTPVRVRPAEGGKYLFYKKAKLLFFIGDDGRVVSWMVWRGKGGQ